MQTRPYREHLQSRTYCDFVGSMTGAPGTARKSHTWFHEIM
jgi:hypothetical protein